MSTPPLAATTTVGAACNAAAERLTLAGIEEARREARILVAAALRLDLAGLILSESQPLDDRVHQVEVMLARREAREPLTRILGRREFFGLDLALGQATLDPRPDTETLVEAVLTELSRHGQAGLPLRLADIGTGTGAILLALLSRLPEASGIGIDLAPAAVVVAVENAAGLGFGARARFVVGDLLGDAGEKFDVIVSNPPYIPSGEIAGLDPEVRLHDPLLALDGGQDGLDFYRRITAAAPAYLSRGGLLAFEVGMGQARAVAGLMVTAGFSDAIIERDLAGIERVVLARLQ